LPGITIDNELDNEALCLRCLIDVWNCCRRSNEYEQSATLTGHSNFVNSVCVINPSERDPKGYIITGSNDNTICVYVADETVPAHVITAHQNNVCNLKTGKKDGTFLSSSWDLTAKLWDVKDLSKPQLNLVGRMVCSRFIEWRYNKWIG